MINDPTNVQFYSGYNTFKNYDSTAGSVTIPSTSYTAGTYKLYSFTIALDNTLAVTQVLHNFSTSGFEDRYYHGNGIVQVNFVPTSNFSTQVRTSYNGTSATVDVYVVNQTGGTVSSSEFTVTTTIRRFVTPFE